MIHSSVNYFTLTEDEVWYDKELGLVDQAGALDRLKKWKTAESSLVELFTFVRKTGSSLIPHYCNFYNFVFSSIKSSNTSCTK